MGFLKIESVMELSALVLSLRSSSNFKTKLEAAVLFKKNIIKRDYRRNSPAYGSRSLLGSRSSLSD